MTSAIAHRSNQKPSKAAQMLAIATGKTNHCVQLRRMQHSEIEALLTELLYLHDLRALQGFTELSSALKYTHDVMIKYNTTVGPDTHLVFQNGKLEPPLDFKSHVCNAGFLSRSVVFQHKETGEQTANYDDLCTWGPHNGFLKSGKDRVLMIRRLPDTAASYASDTLIETSYEFTKIPKQNTWIIGPVTVRSLPIRGFCHALGEDAHVATMGIIQTLSRIASQTANHLQSRAGAMRRKADDLDRLCSSVTHR